MNLQKVGFSGTTSQLPHSFNERCRFDVAHGSPKFNDTNVGLLSGLVDRNASNTFDPVLDCVCQMRNDLNRLS